MPKFVIALNVWNTNYHITVCVISCTASVLSDVTRDIVKNYGRFLGSKNNFILKFDTQWGKNSILTKSFNPTNNTGLEKLREQMFSRISNFPGVVVDTSRYPQNHGFPPQHIDVKGKMNLVGTSITVTYKINSWQIGN